MRERKPAIIDLGMTIRASSRLCYYRGGRAPGGRRRRSGCGNPLPGTSAPGSFQGKTFTSCSFGLWDIILIDYSEYVFCDCFLQIARCSFLSTLFDVRFLGQGSKKNRCTFLAVRPFVCFCRSRQLLLLFSRAAGRPADSQRHIPPHSERMRQSISQQADCFVPAVTLQIVPATPLKNFASSSAASCETLTRDYAVADPSRE